MITFTQSAMDQIKSIISNGQYKALRLSMKKYGCSGMTYELNGVTDLQEGDLKLDVNGYDFYIDPTIQSFLVGCEIDYSRGVFDEGFIFNNPNQKGGCGCGQSFNFE